jgi:hypothetical protein
MEGDVCLILFSLGVCVLPPVDAEIQVWRRLPLGY